jgi:hypothetical protein
MSHQPDEEADCGPSQVSPALAAQLADGPADGLVKVILACRMPDPSDVVEALPLRALVEDILSTIPSPAGASPAEVRFYPNVPLFAVEASREFIRLLLRDPRIASAMPAAPSEDLWIRPLKPTEALPPKKLTNPSSRKEGG